MVSGRPDRGVDRDARGARCGRRAPLRLRCRANPGRAAARASSARCASSPAPGEFADAAPGHPGPRATARYSCARSSADEGDRACRDQPAQSLARGADRARFRPAQAAVAANHANEFPPFAATVLAIAIAGTFLPDLIGLISSVFTAALLFAYALLGFAVLHSITRGFAGRGFMLGGLIRGRPVRLAVVLMSLLGFVESMSACARARRAPAAASPNQPNNPNHTKRRKNMEVILLERVGKLGQMGDVVRVKDGFARNFLLPKGKALRATKDNRAKFEGMKVQLEARNLELQDRGREGRRQAERQELRGAAAGVRNRTIVRLGIRARHRQPSGRRRVHGDPQPDRAACADQDDRPAHCAGRAASGSRGRQSRSTSRATPTRPSARRAART